MHTPNIKEVVREKYGQVARNVKSGGGNCCCGEVSALEPLRSDNLKSLLRRAGRRSPGHGYQSLSWLRQPHGACGIETWRNRARSWLRRRH